ncbi:MAG: serine/threonine-protein kinase [Candidatus Korobacteraceae bacterium]
MVTCSGCGALCSDNAQLCPSCGRAIAISDAPTLEPRGTTPRPAPAPVKSPTLQGAGFSPGTVLIERYRIVALLGRGGMGEVYRAEDLKLGNVVALKFLPASLQDDAVALAGLHAEVRNARQVSHPNVCRVYDIGEVSGQHFLTMEYIDGEDLASLLRRIGRLPPDKALETAHQICAGLAAAHDCGLLHRDLKPANIMLDGRGRVRITDFGLALSSDDATGRSETAGTPAYMAPEQIGKGEASVRSDIYSLGLVFYELFTGHLPYQANTAIEWRRAHLESSPKAPSSVVKDIDPAVESAILRCLQKDPAKRPSSVRQVAAAFPGGDPLAAALAAGETPSPEMVAASGETEGLRPLIAWLMLAAVIVSTTAVILMSAQTQLYRRVPLEKPPEALAEHARDILQSAGYSEPPADTAMGLYEGKEFLRYIAEYDKSKTRWDNLETGAFVFWYRGSPRPLAAGNIFSDAPILGSVWTNDPPLDVSGMTLVSLNPLGRLTQLIAVPPQVEKPAGVAPAPDWAPLFSAAGLDPSKWKPMQPTWTPPVYSDARAAWTGSLAERPNIPMRIEAAAYRGKPVYFELIGPWTRPERMQPYQPTTGERAFLVIFIVLLLAVLVGSALLARRNLRLARGDRRGAFRVAAFVFVAWAVAWFFGAHHLPNFPEIDLFIEFLVWGSGFFCFTWLLYIALEPYVRRRWPTTLVSWSRLLAGGFRDPLVGRDVLAGCLLCATTTLVGRLLWFVPKWVGYPPARPFGSSVWQYLDARTIIANISDLLIGAPIFWLAALFVLVLLRASLRKEWAAAIAWVLLFSVFSTARSEFVPVDLVGTLIFFALAVFCLIRFGLLTLVTNYVLYGVLQTFPLTTQGSAWYAGISLAGIMLMAAIALYAFYTSVGGRPVFAGATFEE